MTRSELIIFLGSLFAHPTKTKSIRHFHSWKDYIFLNRTVAIIFLTKQIVKKAHLEDKSFKIILVIFTFQKPLLWSMCSLDKSCPMTKLTTINTTVSTINCTIILGKAVTYSCSDVMILFKGHCQGGTSIHYSQSRQNNNKMKIKTSLHPFPECSIIIKISFSQIMVLYLCVCLYDLI